MAKIGDIVRFLSSTGGGTIVKIDGQIAHVEEEDGFVTPVLLKELVVVTPAGESAGSGTRDAFGGTMQAAQRREAERQSKFVPTVMPEVERPQPVVETPTGDRINLVLAYQPVEIKHLTTTTYETYLVNDSNYYLYFTYLSRADGDEGWTTRFAGVIEPNIQLFIEELDRDQIGLLDRIAVQYIAFKRDKQFTLKAPVAIERPLDVTKFFKLHCFHDNPYFDTPVIAVDIVKNDIPQRQMTVDSSTLEDAIRRKKHEDTRPLRRPVTRRDIKPDGPLVTDLHIGQLLDTTRGMSNADILNYQIDTFRKVMDDNIRFPGKKLIFIHGKGEGTLRQALMKELSHRYKGHDVQDASFREYGYGATQVTIRRH
ncbi:MAG: DUF2027 domain-containing protein [Muribaculaceae bacterium]|nr:DUF2027 domain-containing protein [Muribaculaceae bacterium]